MMLYACFMGQIQFIKSLSFLKIINETVPKCTCCPKTSPLEYSVIDLKEHTAVRMLIRVYGQE